MVRKRNEIKMKALKFLKSFSVAVALFTKMFYLVCQLFSEVVLCVKCSRGTVLHEGGVKWISTLPPQNVPGDQMEGGENSLGKSLRIWCFHMCCKMWKRFESLLHSGIVTLLYGIITGSNPTSHLKRVVMRNKSSYMLLFELAANSC